MALSNGRVAYDSPAVSIDDNANGVSFWAHSTRLCAQPCPWGSRSDGFVCVACRGPPSSYSVCFYVFMITAYYVSDFIVFLLASDSLRYVASIFVATSAELVVGLISALLLFPPTGSLSLNSCDLTSFYDWYAPLMSPSGVHCGNEANFPLYSFLLAFFALNVPIALLVRITYVAIAKRFRHSDIAVYSKLWLSPAFALVHFLLGPLLYYCFPYVLLTASVVLDCFALSDWGGRSSRFDVDVVAVHFSTLLARIAASGFSLLSIFFFFGLDTVWRGMAFVIPTGLSILTLFVCCRRRRD